MYISLSVIIFVTDFHKLFNIPYRYVLPVKSRRRCRTWQKLQKNTNLCSFNTKQDEDKIKELVEKFKALIETEGTVSEINTWGKRKLAYEINDETEGYYVLYTFEAKPELPKELERVLKITDGVLRSLVTVA